MKKDYLINLNHCIDLICKLRDNQIIDEDTQSLFHDIVYKAREFNFHRSTKKIRTLTQDFY
jgi:hypothetical protein